MAVSLKIGWAQADITPPYPRVFMAGQFYSRISEGVLDPLTVTAWALESGAEQVVFVSCDLVTISDEMRDAVRSKLREQIVELDPMKVIIHATHTHAGPVARLSSPLGANVFFGGGGIEQEDAMPIEDYIVYATEQVVLAVEQAWTSRAQGGISFGQGYAVVGHNRRWVDADNKATMYGLKAALSDRFRHIEGYEDHSLQLLATYDAQNNLTGIVVNIPCPSQESEHEFSLSADYWHETRQELRTRFGESIFILPQCSAAGDLSPHLLFGQKGYDRMLALKGRTSREEIAHRIADAAGDILPYLSKEIQTTIIMRHHTETIHMATNQLTEADVHSAERETEIWSREYQKEVKKLEEQPEQRNVPRWYKDVTNAYGRMNWNANVAHRYEYQKTHTTLPVEIHVVRLGDVAFATNPFEYYVDSGIQIKVRSPATQTFLVQLAGAGTYVPSPRSVRGGGYGSVPASNPIGPEGGQQLAEHTVQAMALLWKER